MNKGNYVDFYGEDDMLYKSICETIEDDSREQIEEMYTVAADYTWDAYVNRIKDTIERG